MRWRPSPQGLVGTLAASLARHEHDNERVLYHSGTDCTATRTAHAKLRVPWTTVVPSGSEPSLYC